MPQIDLSDLPTPSNDALASSERLTQRIIEQIRDAGGWMPFHTYMQMALYEPGLGYYVAGAQKFGEAGDFVTAPELGPLFARCMAQQCAQLLRLDPSLHLLEFGAGSGRLAVDLMTELQRLDALPGSYHILEPSPDLQQRQQQAVQASHADWVDRVQWASELPNEGFRGIVIANEVLDAMPVRRLRVDRDDINEMGVSELDGKLHWQVGESNENLSHLLPDGLPNGYETEMNPQLKPWLSALSTISKELLVLIIDYGYPAREYYLEERIQGTLMGYYRHRAISDPFLYPGLQDLTAHVDFTSVAEAALEAELDVLGYTSQALFLMATGLEQWAQDCDPEDVQKHLQFSSEIKTLTLPSEMGERFKVMALGRGSLVNAMGPLQGFVYGDQRAML